MILIVTGGIGSGKSEVCRILNGSYGYPVYNADKRAKELYTIYPELLDSIEARLQGRFRNNESVFCPKMLAERIFNDKSALETVESLEYSDKLECIRFICNYSICEASSNLSFEKNEYLLYISATEHPNIIMYLERSSKHQIVYVDRT